MTYSNFSNESGIFNLYNDYMLLSILLGFFLLFSFFFSQDWYIYWRFGIFHAIKGPFPTNISQQILMFFPEVFRSWFFYFFRIILENFFHITIIGQTTPCNVLFQCANPSVNEIYSNTKINKRIYI